MITPPRGQAARGCTVHQVWAVVIDSHCSGSRVARGGGVRCPRRGISVSPIAYTIVSILMSRPSSRPSRRARYSWQITHLPLGRAIQATRKACSIHSPAHGAGGLEGFNDTVVDVPAGAGGAVRHEGAFRGRWWRLAHSAHETAMTALV